MRLFASRSRYSRSEMRWAHAHRPLNGYANVLDASTFDIGPARSPKAAAARPRRRRPAVATPSPSRADRFLTERPQKPALSGR